MERSYFKEEQKFDQWWFRLIMILTWIALVVIFGWGIYQQLVLKKPWGDHPTSDNTLILTTICVFLIMSGVIWLTFTMRLITEVTDEGLRYRFPPLINTFRTIPKSMIAEYKIRKYNPIGEYGGWGIKGTGFLMGKAYNVKGNIGLQLRLQNNKKILFGTQRPDALLAAMDKMMRPGID
jgi:hypothetical protein